MSLEPLTYQPRHLNAEPITVLVNLATVSAVMPDDDGCTLYWMDAHTSWNVIESMEYVLARSRTENVEES